jgi:sigma-B regulation protein RsbU (phosphoserine phosphatase)
MTGSWDFVRIEQAISNLVGNAVQHGAPEIPVALRVDGRGSSLLLTLHNGGAIDPELLPNVFTPFKRVRKGPATSASSGLGLGLYISHQIIKAHGGDIQVRSSPEEGTTFVVRLPRVCPPSADPSERAEYGQGPRSR